jgi:hypothetical protein
VKPRVDENSAVLVARRGHVPWNGAAQHVQMRHHSRTSISSMRHLPR